MEDIDFDQAVVDELYDAVGPAVTNILNTYIETFPDSIADMQKGLDTNDTEITMRAAHSLKSSSANLGLAKISSKARDLEQDLKSNVEVDIESQIKEFQQMFADTKPKLEDYINSHSS